MMRAIHWRWMLFRVRIGSHESKPLLVKISAFMCLHLYKTLVIRSSYFPVVTPPFLIVSRVYTPACQGNRHI
jgi:hypothetical protein